MLTVEIDEQILDCKELHKRPKIYTQSRDEVPCGYITAEEWLIRSKKNISEIFRKHEKGLLQ
jgi:hypothetical protein